jgi:hypothetical protein
LTFNLRDQSCSNFFTERNIQDNCKDLKDENDNGMLGVDKLWKPKLGVNYGVSAVAGAATNLVLKNVCTDELTIKDLVKAGINVVKSIGNGNAIQIAQTYSHTIGGLAQAGIGLCTVLVNVALELSILNYKQRKYMKLCQKFSIDHRWTINKKNGSIQFNVTDVFISKVYKEKLKITFGK